MYVKLEHKTQQPLHSQFFSLSLSPSLRLSLSLSLSLEIKDNIHVLDRERTTKTMALMSGLICAFVYRICKRTRLSPFVYHTNMPMGFAAWVYIILCSFSLKTWIVCDRRASVIYV